MTDPNSGRSKTRQIALMAVAILGFAGAGLLAWKGLAGTPTMRAASDRMYMCSECGKIFEHTIALGESEPMECPACKKKAAWEAEKCYWTKDGKGKLDPTYVLLKQRMGIAEKTLCPDCGHEVRGHNPMPPPEVMEEAKAAGRR